MKFRPHFSIRTLAIFVTLVCAYLGAWEATKKYGVHDDRNAPESSPAPFLIKKRVGAGAGTRTYILIDGYYLWVLTGRLELPFYSEHTHVRKAFQDKKYPLG